MIDRNGARAAHRDNGGSPRRSDSPGELISPQPIHAVRNLQGGRAARTGADVRTVNRPQSNPFDAVRFAALREREITTVLMDRYHGPVLDDDAGLDDLRLLLAHAAHRKNGRERVPRIISTWAPWLSEVQRIDLANEILRGPLPFYTADQLGQRLGLTMAKRAVLGQRKNKDGTLKIIALTTIGAVDASAEDREVLARRKKAEGEKRRRQKWKEQQQLADVFAEYRGRGPAVRQALFGRGPTSVAELASVLGSWAAFKGLKPAALRKAIVRELKPASGRKPKWLRTNEELVIKNVGPPRSALQVWRVWIIENAP